MGGAVLEYRGVRKSYGPVSALQGIDLAVSRGEIFGIVGPDGAGKSTMIRIAMGILRADAGQLRVLDTARLRSERGRLGYVPQHFSLYLNLTVLENIRLYGSLYGVSADEADRRGREILERTELWDFRDRFAGALSGGMKQKLALAVGLVHSPELLFLDEPTAGVDPIARREFWGMLYEFNASGVTVVVSTPYMDEAELCKRLIFLDRGQILLTGTPAEALGAYRYRLLELDTSDRRVEKLLQEVPGVMATNLFGARYHVEVDESGGADASRSVEKALREGGLPGVSATSIPPSLEDLFVSLSGSSPTDEGSSRSSAGGRA